MPSLQHYCVHAANMSDKRMTNSPHQVCAFYYNGRRMGEPAHSKDEQYCSIHDGGARIRNEIKSLQKYGVCSAREHWSYASDATDSNQDNLWTSNTASERQPPSKVLNPATNDFKIGEFKRYLGTEFSYYSIADASSFAAKPMSLVTQLEKSLIAGYPFIFGLIEYADANLNEHVDENGVFVDPPKDILDAKGVRISLDPIGGHAILCVGCDQQGERLLIRNVRSRLGHEGG
ncbi:hypothetical protein N7G274_008785 [Stereocaulon virgatum]|uniref:Uncharacterized protein n=1 Tax=Stereocaulon virgatum TaxID=373712 RepID=A0ABR4A0D4_9LECA